MTELEREIQNAERLLKLAEVCRRLDISRTSVYKWIQTGQFDGGLIQLPNGHYRVTLSKLEEILHNETRKSA